MRTIDADELKKQFPVTVWATIDRMPTIEPEPHWIPCSERLPEEPGNYLVSIKRVKRVGWNYKKYVENDMVYWDGIFHKADEVIAWMPLPEPWEEGE